MKTLLFFFLLTLSCAADWSDDAIARLQASDQRMDTAGLNVRLVLLEDRRFGALLKQARANVVTLPTAKQYAFEQRLDMEEEFHIRRLTLASEAFEHMAQSQAVFNRQENMLQELQAIERALRCWR